jgi:hypothetical protein
MSYVKAPFLNEASAPTRKKSRAKQVNINELLKFYNQAPQTTSPNYLTANASPSTTIPEFTPSNRHRACITNKEITNEKRAVSSNVDGKKRDRSKVTFVLNTNDINRALSQVLIDFKEFKTDQQQNSSEGKKQRFKSNKTNFSDLSDKNAQFLNKVHLNINDYYDDTSNEFKSTRLKPPVHDRTSRGILKELNLGKRAVSSNEHVKHKYSTNESGHFPSPILKSSTQFIRNRNDTVKSKKVKSLTFKEVDPGEKCASSANSRDRQEIIKFNPDTSVTINLPIKVHSKESDRQKSITFSPKMETHRSSSFTNSKNLSKIYSNLIDKIDQDLLKKEETPVARISLKDSSKKSSNIKPHRSQSSYDYLLSKKNQTLPRINSFHRQPSRDKSLCDSVKNFKSDIADLFNTHDSNNDEGEYSYAQTSEYFSQSEKKIIDSLEPIETAEKSEIEVFGQRGIWLNKSEEMEWKGDRPLSDYPLNLDLNPKTIRKKPLNNQIEYIQSLAIRYLKPPTPQLPGEIVIIQEPDTIPNPAPPIIIRQEPNKPETPEPLIIREAPPKPPEVCKKRIKITLRGKQLSPPPRKVILEKLPELPSRPCPILIERWLPYSQVKRKVIFQPASPVQNYEDTKNVIINWSQPSVSIRKEFKYLGISKANPDEYVKNFGATLKEPNEVSSFVPDYKNFDTVESLCESTGLYEITSSANTLNQIKTKSKDIKSKQFGLNKVKIAAEVENFSYEKKSEAVDCLEKHEDSSNNLEIAAAKVIQASQTFSSCNSSTAVKLAFNSASFIALNDIISQIFEKVDQNNNGFISVEEATQIFTRLNYHLNRKIEERDIHEHFDLFSMRERNSVNLDEFKTIFFKLSA